MFLLFIILFTLTFSSRESKNWRPNKKSGCKATGGIGQLTQFPMTCDGDNEKASALQGFELHGACPGTDVEMVWGCKDLPVNPGKIQRETYLAKDAITNGRMSGLFQSPEQGNVPKCVDAEGRKNGLLSSVYLYESQQYRYKWTWSCLEMKVKNCRDQYTNDLYNQRNDIRSMYFQEVKCPRDEFLNFVQFVQHGSSYRWKYNCCQLDSGVADYEKRMSKKRGERFGNGAVMWIEEANMPSGNVEYSSSWDASEETVKEEQHSSEFSSGMEHGWSVDVCAGVSLEVESPGKSFFGGATATASLETCHGAYGSYSQSKTSSSMTGTSVANGYSVGQSQTCSLSMPSYCEKDGCTLWRWSVSREYNSRMAEYTTLRTCLFQFQRGEFRHLAPNCHPNHCHIEDPSCLTCDEPIAQFYPLAALIDDYFVCPLETCGWVKASTAECPERNAMSDMLKCSSWRKQHFDGPSLCVADAPMLPDGRTTDMAENCHGRAVYRYVCKEKVAPDAYEHSNLNGLCSRLDQVISSVAECEEAAATFGYRPRATVVRSNQPVGCFVQGDDLFFNLKLDSTNNWANEFTPIRSLCRDRVTHLYGSAHSDWRKRHCVQPKSHFYSFSELFPATSFREVIQSREECLHAANLMRLTSDTMPAQKDASFVTNVDIDVSDHRYPMGCSWIEGVLRLNTHLRATPNGAGMIVRKGRRKGEIESSSYWLRRENKRVSGTPANAPDCTNTKPCTFDQAKAVCDKLSDCTAVSENQGTFSVRSGGMSDHNGDVTYLKTDHVYLYNGRIRSIGHGDTQSKRCKSSVGFAGKHADVFHCMSAVAKAGGEYFHWNSERKTCEIVYTKNNCDGKLTTVFADNLAFAKLNFAVDIPARRAPCNPNTCPLGRMQCYQESHGLKCSSGALSANAEQRRAQMDADCSAAQSPSFCNAGGIWNSCAVGSNKFSHRRACPIGTWTCMNKSCWSTANECNIGNRGGVLYGPESCVKRGDERRRLLGF